MTLAMFFTVDKDELGSEMISRNVSAFDFFVNAIESFKVNLTVEDVLSEEMCHFLCMSRGNAWTHISPSGNRTCICLTFPTRLCHPLDFNDQTQIPVNESSIDIFIDQTSVTVLQDCRGRQFYPRFFIRPLVHLAFADKLLIPMGVTFTTRFGEVLDFDYENRACQEIGESGIPNFNYPLVGSTGGLLYGRVPFFCGGTTSELSATKSCFTAITYHRIIIEMPSERTFAASILIGHLDRTLFVTGGTSAGYFYIHSYVSEFVTYFLFNPSIEVCSIHLQAMTQRYSSPHFHPSPMIEFLPGQVCPLSAHITVWQKSPKP